MGNMDGILTIQFHIVEKYLMGKKLIIRLTDAEKITKKIIDVLNDFENIHRIQQERARSLVAAMEDPVEVILRVIKDEFPRP
jgi:hypothetical protein